MSVVAHMPEKPEPRYCAATVPLPDGTRRPCRKAPLKGSTLCRNHRGATGVQRRNAAKRLELKAAHQALAQIGMDTQQYVDPRHLLLQAVAVSHQALGAVIEMVKSLEEGDIAAIGSVPIPGVTNTARGARAEAFLQLLGEWTDRAAKVSKVAINAGIQDRLVHLAEQQASLLVGAVRAALAEAGVQDEVQGPFLQALAGQMRLLSTPRVLDLPTPAEAAKSVLPWELDPSARQVSATPVRGASRAGVQASGPAGSHSEAEE